MDYPIYSLKCARRAAALIALTMCASTFAGTACPQHFAGGEPPQVTNERMQPKTRELCYVGFAVLHSGISRTALYSAEHLTRESVTAAREQVRVDEFHPESRLSRSERSELSDFARSGFDRGHLSPSGDAASPQAQAETFTLANMVPQQPANNRGVWSDIESAVRDLAQKRGGLYVITGPLFETENLKMLKNRVLVPTSLFKLVYDPRSGRAAAYVSPNDSSGAYSTVTVAALEQRAGLRLLPDLGGIRSRAALQLPTPHAGRGGSRAGGGFGRHSPHATPIMHPARGALRALTHQLFR